MHRGPLSEMPVSRSPYSAPAGIAAKRQATNREVNRPRIYFVGILSLDSGDQTLHAQIDHEISVVFPGMPQVPVQHAEPGRHLAGLRVERTASLRIGLLA